MQQHASIHLCTKHRFMPHVHVLDMFLNFGVLCVYVYVCLCAVFVSLCVCVCICVSVSVCVCVQACVSNLSSQNSG